MAQIDFRGAGLGTAFEAETVFVAGATIIVDLIVLITRFLGGEELSTAFLLKVLVVLLVAGAGFLHFLSDLRGYWNRYPGKAKMINWSVGIVVIIAIISGFFIVGTPFEARLYRLDAERVTDLESIQWQITNYWQTKESLPQTLEDLEDPLIGFVVPNDPQTGEEYRYNVLDNVTFELCAIFDKESRKGIGDVRPLGLESAENQNWQHQEGETCFERKIDPDRFPELKGLEVRVPVR